MADDSRVCSKKGCHQELPSSENYGFRLCDKCRTKARLAKQKQLQRGREKAAEQRSNHSATPVSTSVQSLHQTPALSAIPTTAISSLSTALTAPMGNQSSDLIPPGQGLVTWSTCRFKPLDGDYVLSYTLFRGLGPPPVFLGLLGDVYLDVTQGHLQLYGRTIQGWVIWPGPKETQHLIVHPGINDRFLWCSASHSAVGWLTPDEVSADTKTASECLAQVVETSQPAKRKAEFNDVHSVKRLKLETSSLLDLKYSADESSISMNGIRPHNKEANTRTRRKLVTSTTVTSSSRFKLPRTAPLPSRRRAAVPKYVPRERQTPRSSFSIKRQSRKRRLQELEHELSTANNTIGVLQQMMFRAHAQTREPPNHKLPITAPPTTLPTPVPPTLHTSPTPPTPITSAAPKSAVGGGTVVHDCYNCKAATPFWTKDEKGRIACKECHLHYKTHGSDRPIDEKPRKSSPPVCAKCSTSESSVWRDDNRGRLLCNTCGLHSKWRGPVRVTGYEVAAATLPKKEEIDDDIVLTAPNPTSRPLTITIPPLKSLSRNKPKPIPQRTTNKPVQSASAPVGTTLADKRCYNCDAPSSRSWTKIEGKPACNRCWQYRRRKGIDRPNNISTNALRTKSCRETAAKNAQARRAAAATTVNGTARDTADSVVQELKIKREFVETPVSERDELEEEDDLEELQVKEEEKPAKSLKSKHKSTPTNRCYNCGTTHSACGRWPKISDGRRACNRCFLYWRAHGFDRPNVTTQTALRIKTKEMEANTQPGGEVVTTPVTDNVSNNKPTAVSVPPVVVNENTPIESRCYNCDTTYSMSGWWPKISDGRTACNRCWLYHRRKGVHRPKGISSDELRKQSLKETWAKQKKIKAEALEAELSETQSSSAPPA